MIDPSMNPSSSAGAATATDPPGVPMVVDCADWQAEPDALRIREKAHSHQGDAIADGRSDDLSTTAGR